MKRRHLCSWPTCDRHDPGAAELCDAHAWRSRRGYDMNAPIKRMPRDRSLRDRLYERVDRGDESNCWLYLGHTRPDQGRRGLVVGTYGRMADGRGGTDYVHRISYELHHGPIPAGSEIRHKCDTPNCVNPDHGDQTGFVFDADPARLYLSDGTSREVEW